MKWTYHIARVRGIPIKLHITLVIYLLVVLVSDYAHPVFLLILLVGGLTSLTLHELGHCHVALKEGCGVRDIILLPIGAVARLESIPKSTRGELLMALAGPAVSLSLATLLGIPSLALLLSHGITPNSPWFLVLNAVLSLATLNLAWAIFNMLPAFPMDGGRVLRAALSNRLGRLKATEIASRVGPTLAVVMGLVAIFRLHSFTLLLIAILVHHLAGREYKAMVMQRNAERFGFRFWPQSPPADDPYQAGPMRDVNDADIGPAPYDDSP